MVQAGSILEAVWGTWPLLAGTLGFAAWYFYIARAAGREPRRPR